MVGESRYIIFLCQINPPLVLANAQLLVLCQLSHLAVMAFVAQGGGGREEEGAEQHGGDEGQAEEREGMSGEEDAVAGGEG